MKSASLWWPCKLVYLLFILLVGGCGGGSGSGENPNPAPAEPGTFSLQGTVLTDGTTAVDSDVNDPQAPFATNDTLQTAQPMANPVLIGGYVNRPFAGPAGRSRILGDVTDFYSVELKANQVVSLFVASNDQQQNDLDLGLLDSNGELVNVSAGVLETESLRVPSDGKYFVLVEAFRGASNYILSIGQEVTVLGNGWRLNDDFIADEATLMFKAGQLAAQQVQGMQMAGGDPSRRMLFRVADRNLMQVGLHKHTGFTINDSQQQRKYETLLLLKQLQRLPQVSQAMPNYRYHALLRPNDPLYRFQWHYEQIGLPQAWDMTLGSNAVIAAVVDSGVLLEHPELRTKLVPGFDFVSSPLISVDGDGIDADPNDPGDGLTGGSSFHGSHVAGTIAASTNNKSGVAGVSWLSRIMPIRALGLGGSASSFDVEQGIRFAAGLPNDSGRVPEQAADIINLSLGGPAIDAGLEKTLREVRSGEIFIVAASGNDNSSTPGFPAASEGVISVGAVDINKARASYSNFGSTLDLVAPGGDGTADVNGDGVPDGILSTVADDSDSGRLTFKASISVGTSMAAPHVSGVIALMKAINPDLTPDDFDRLLAEGRLTEDLGPSGRDDEFGFGLIDANAAVRAASGLRGNPLPPRPPELTVVPRSLNFGLAADRLTVTLSNGGEGDLTIVQINNNTDFLSILPQQTDAGGLGSYLVTVNRDRLAAGTYSTTLSFVSSANTVDVAVIMQVGDPALVGDAGLHFVLLLKPDTLTTIQQVEALAVNGQYSFRFDNVPPGEYLLLAGSDLDNDLFICDPGEACGGYLTLDRPSALSVTKNLTGLRFQTGYNVNFSPQTLSISVGPTGAISRQSSKQVYR